MSGFGDKRAGEDWNRDMGLFFLIWSFRSCGRANDIRVFASQPVTALPLSPFDVQHGIKRETGARMEKNRMGEENSMEKFDEADDFCVCGLTPD